MTCGRCHTEPAVPSAPGPRRCATCRAMPTIRSRPRRSLPRAVTTAQKRLTRAVMAADALTAEDRAALEQRPKTRGDCANTPRPCPWVGCRYSLYLDVNPSTGSIKLNFPHLEPGELEHSCALDLADADTATLDEVGGYTNLTRERVRQIELRALLRLADRLEVAP